MKLLRFDRMEDLDFPRLAKIYREGFLATISYFSPRDTDPERGLRMVEEKFLEYYRTDFFAVPGRRCYVLEDGGRWVSTIRLFPVPGQPGVWHAEALETAPDCRRRGYARSLFSLLFRELEAEGPFTLTDTVNQTNAASLALHTACGFECFQDPAVSVLTGKTLPGKYGMRYHAAGKPDLSRAMQGKEGAKRVEAAAL